MTHPLSKEWGQYVDQKEEVDKIDLTDGYFDKKEDDAVKTKSEEEAMEAAGMSLSRRRRTCTTPLTPSRYRILLFVFRKN